MNDNGKPKGDLHLPEYASLMQIFNHLRDRVNDVGHPQMGTFIVDSDLVGIMVVGKFREIAHLSRLIATIGGSPLVKMEVGN